MGNIITMPFAALLRWLYEFTASYGLSIILFALVIKLVLLPFQMKSKRSMVRMNRMSGKMQGIQKKYANNQLKMQEEMQKFYQEEGFNPMSGCLWSFLPLPILMALYYIIREPIVYFMNFGGKDAGLAVVEAAWPRSWVSPLRSSVAAVPMVRLMLVPVSPSGTGNTFRSLIFCFCRVMAAAPWSTMCLN